MDKISCLNISHCFSLANEDFNQSIKMHRNNKINNTQMCIHELGFSVFGYSNSPSKIVKANIWILIVLLLVEWMQKDNGLVIEYLSQLAVVAVVVRVLLSQSLWKFPLCIIFLVKMCSQIGLQHGALLAAEEDTETLDWRIDHTKVRRQYINSYIIRLKIRHNLQSKCKLRFVFLFFGFFYCNCGF